MKVFTTPKRVKDFLLNGHLHYVPPVSIDLRFSDISWEKLDISNFPKS